jgi:hypothetical protein
VARLTESVALTEVSVPAKIPTWVVPAALSRIPRKISSSPKPPLLKDLCCFRGPPGGSCDRSWRPWRRPGARLGWLGRSWRWRSRRRAGRRLLARLRRGAAPWWWVAGLAHGVTFLIAGLSDASGIGRRRLCGDGWQPGSPGKVTSRGARRGAARPPGTHRPHAARPGAPSPTGAAGSGCDRVVGTHTLAARQRPPGPQSHLHQPGRYPGGPGARPLPECRSMR